MDPNRGSSLKQSMILFGGIAVLFLVIVVLVALVGF